MSGFLILLSYHFFQLTFNVTDLSAMFSDCEYSRKRAIYLLIYFELLISLYVHFIVGNENQTHHMLSSCSLKSFCNIKLVKTLEFIISHTPKCLVGHKQLSFIYSRSNRYCKVKTESFFLQRMCRAMWFCG